MGERTLTGPGSNRWRLACFDLDGTLVRRTSVSQHLADRFGQSEQMAELERRYISGEISNSVVAEEQARNYRGIPLPQVAAKLSDIACIGDSDGVPTGEVKRHFDEWDKLEFVRSYCAANGIDLAACIAVGDSRSDVPLFEAVGFSVALNATLQAREAASVPSTPRT